MALASNESCEPGPNPGILEFPRPEKVGIPPGNKEGMCPGGIARLLFAVINESEGANHDGRHKICPGGVEERNKTALKEGKPQWENSAGESRLILNQLLSTQL